MQRNKVKSSNLSSVGYDEETKTLEIEFYDGAVWQYAPVTREGYTDFINAPSLGSYFARHIKNNENLEKTKIL